MIARKILTLKQSYGLKCWQGKGAGNFFTYHPDIKGGDNTGSAYDCRESIGWMIRTGTILWVGFKLNRTAAAPSVARLFAYIERKLGLEKRSIVHRTTEANCLVVEASPWWMQTEIRRGFFTLMLRLGAVYYSRDFDTALKKYSLASECIPAIKRFLDGYTEINDSVAMKPDYGFVHHLANKSEKQLSRLLLKP